MRASEAECAGRGRRLRPGGDSGLPGLTGQELRVSQLVASGLSNREVAAQLYVSPKTVKYHLAHAFTKLGVRSRHKLPAGSVTVRTQGSQPREKPREIPDADRVVYP